MNAAQIRPYFLLSALGAAAALVFLILKPFLIPLALAAIFAVVLAPIHRFFLQRVKWPSLSALFTILTAVICLLVPLSFIGVQMVREAQHLLNSLTSGSSELLVQNALATLEGSFGLDLSSDLFASISDAFDTYAQSALSWVVAHLGGLFSGAFSVLLSFVPFLFALFFFLRDGHRFRDFLVKLSPLQDSDDDSILTRLESAINSVVRGNITVAFVQAILSAVGFAIFGLPNPILWGALTGFAAFIPAVGTSLVLVPSVIYLLLFGTLFQSVGLAIWAFVAVGLIDNVLGPRLVGKGAQLHPLIVLFSVLGGVSYFGPAGVFLGPLSASLLLSLLSLYSAPARQ